jgi:hypothetical protein
MMFEILIMLGLLAAIITLSVFLYKCRKDSVTTDALNSQLQSRAKPVHPAYAAYQKHLKSFQPHSYEYKMYETFTDKRPIKKYHTPTVEEYTLADYDKVQNCSCKNIETCTHSLPSRGWSPASDTI